MDTAAAPTPDQRGVRTVRHLQAQGHSHAPDKSELIDKLDKHAKIMRNTITRCSEINTKMSNCIELGIVPVLVTEGNSVKEIAAVEKDDAIAGLQEGAQNFP